jgi:hypothetical protein
MESKKASKIIVEYEDGSKTTISDKFAVLFQTRVNTSGIMVGIEVEETNEQED